MNHFRTGFNARPPPLPHPHAVAETGLVSVEDVARKLHEVNMGPLTVQTMIFEPGPLRLHLAIGACPASALPLKPLDLAELFRPARPSPDANSGGLKTPRRGNKMLSSGRHAADAQ